MLLGLGLMTAVIAVLLVFPTTSMGRGLRRALVEAPARLLNRAPRGKAVFYLALAMLGFLLILLFEFEGARLFGFLLPDTLVWFAMFDVGVFIDALLIAGAILATNGVRTLRTLAVALPRQVRVFIARHGARARRVIRPSSRPNPESSDDDPRWAQPGYRAFNMA